MISNITISESIANIRARADGGHIANIENDFIVAKGIRSSCHLLQSPYRLDAVIIGICKKGSATIGVNLMEYELSKEMFFVNMPDNIMQLKYKNDVSVDILIISVDFMKEIQVDVKKLIPLHLQTIKDPRLSVSKNDMNLLGKYIDLIYETVIREGIYAKEITRKLVSSMVYSVANIIEGSGKEELGRTAVAVVSTNTKEILFERFMALLTEHHRLERSVAFYAEQLHITPKYLSGLIKDVSGRSASVWIDNYVILEAKTLLKFSTMSIQEIAYYLNFANQSFFGKYFKHLTGMSPGEYKNS